MLLMAIFLLIIPAKSRSMENLCGFVRIATGSIARVRQFVNVAVNELKGVTNERRFQSI